MPSEPLAGDDRVRLVATLLVGPEQLGGQRVVVGGDAYRHLFRARRLAVGERLRVVDGRGGSRAAVVEEVERSSATLRLEEALVAAEPDLRLEVGCAARRPERASWLVEKLGELGVRRIVFYDSERSQHRYADRQQARFERVARSALEQSGGSVLPAIELDRRFDELLAEAPDAAAPATVVLDLRHPPQEPALLRGAARMRLVIGPEGGFSPHEEERLAARYALGVREGGWLPMRLGPRVLRVETAALVASGLLLVAPWR